MRTRKASPGYYIAVGTCMSAMQFSFLAILVPQLFAFDEPAVEICDDGIDNNENGATDCSDPACGLHQACFKPSAPEVQQVIREVIKEVSEPASAPAPAVQVIREVIKEVPSAPLQPIEVINEVQVIKPVEVQKEVTEVIVERRVTTVGEHLPEKEKECQDGVDNDSNGLTDCDDKNCVSHPVCARKLQQKLTTAEIQLLDD